MLMHLLTQQWRKSVYSFLGCRLIQHHLKPASGFMLQVKLIKTDIKICFIQLHDGKNKAGVKG